MWAASACLTALVIASQAMNQAVASASGAKRMSSARTSMGAGTRVARSSRAAASPPSLSSAGCRPLGLRWLPVGVDPLRPVLDPVRDLQGGVAQALPEQFLDGQARLRILHVLPHHAQSVEAAAAEPAIDAVLNRAPGWCGDTYGRKGGDGHDERRPSRYGAQRTGGD